MKQLLILAAAVVFTATACNPSNNNPGERGAINDGMDAVDTNGALQDTGSYKYTPPTDTTKAEDRVDVQPRQ